MNDNKLRKKEIASRCSFEIVENNVFYKKSLNNEEKKELLDIFNKNIKKTTFLGIILPCNVFLLIFLVTILFMLCNQKKGNFGNEVFNIYMFLFFISIILGVLGIVLFYKWKIKKEKCYLTISYKAYQYKYISNNDYKKICQFLSERI